MFLRKLRINTKNVYTPKTNKFMKLQLLKKEFSTLKQAMLVAGMLLLTATSSFSQCTYTGTPLTQVGSDYTFCIDNTNTITTASVNAGQYVVVNVVKGFTYTFSVGNVFGGDNENLTIFNATSNVVVSPGFATGASGATISNWQAPFSGKIKILLSKGACMNDNSTGGTLTLTLNSVGNTQDSQTLSGTNQWVGHVYNWTGAAPPGGASPTTPSASNPFTDANYVGYYNIASETIGEGFGGDAVCFSVTSATTNIYTQTFAVRYRMKSTKTGYYTLNVSGDDGIRVYVDNVLVFNEWKEQSSTSYCNNLIYLNGNSDIVFDYYENGGQNTVAFELIAFLPTANTIAGAAVRNVCSGTTPGTLVGSAYVPCTATSIANVTFQWQVSSDNVTFSDIAGATSKDFTVPAITTTTNQVWYYRRIVKQTALNPSNPILGSNVIQVNTSPTTALTISGTISGTTAQCASLTGQVYSISAVANALNYVWTVPTGWTITGGQGTNAITVTAGATGQNGNISVTASNACVVSAAKTLAVTVNAVPTSVTATPSATTFCGSGTINLTATAISNTPAAVTLINENFNGATNTWTTTNTSTGGTPGFAAWMLRPSGYSAGDVAPQNITSNDTSQFYLSDSDKQQGGTTPTTATTLQSPSFSTVGLSAASLSFYHYYRDYDATDFARIEVSTNGTTWTTIQTYTSTQGANNAFGLATVNLSAYLNQPTVSIRFRYNAVNTYYWAIDNVSVTGVPSLPTYAWTSTPAGFTSTQQNPTGVSVTENTTYTVTVTNANGCSASATTVPVTVGPNTWNGSVGLWSVATNWSCNVVPTGNTNVVISAGTPTLDVNYTVGAGKTLTVNNTATLIVNPTRTLTVAGTAAFNDKLVIFKSDATGTAQLGQVSGTVTGATRVTVERFIPQGKRAFRFLTPGVTTTTAIAANWQQAIHITGSTTGANGFDATETGNPSMYTYANQVSSGTGWTPIANTNATPLVAGVGYRTLVRGDRTPSIIATASVQNMNTAVTLAATGTLKTGTVVLNAGSTPAINNTANTTTDGFSLVGNPYVSPIDWNSVGKSGLSSVYYGFEPNFGTGLTRGKYVTYDAATNLNNESSSNIGRYIQTGQAFMVKNSVAGTAGTLTFNETNKVTTQANVFKTTNETNAATTNAILRLSVYDPNELALASYPIDGTVAVFGTDFSNDLGYGDVEKLMSNGENLGLSRASKTLAIEALAPVEDMDELLVKTTQFQANKSYTFKVSTAGFESNVAAYLVDQYLNTQSDITMEDITFATFTTTTDASSYGADRFKIVFRNTVLGNAAFETNAMVVYPNPVTNNTFNISVPTTVNGALQVAIYNLAGQRVYQTSEQAMPVVTIRPDVVLAQGVYIVRITNEGKTTNSKITIQ